MGSLDYTKNYKMIYEKAGALRHYDDVNNRQKLIDFTIRRNLTSLFGMSKKKVDSNGILFEKLFDDVVKPISGRYKFEYNGTNLMCTRNDVELFSHVVVEDTFYTNNGFTYKLSNGIESGYFEEYVVENAVIFGGLKLTYDSNTINIGSGLISIDGYEFTLPAWSQSLVLTSGESRVIVLTMQLNEIEYTEDLSFLGHYISSQSSYHPKSPSALKIDGSFSVVADYDSVPVDTDTSINIIFGEVGNVGNVLYSLSQIQHIEELLQNRNSIFEHFSASQLERIQSFSTDLTLKIGSINKRVVTEDLSINPFINFRITDVSSVMSNDMIDATMVSKLSKGRMVDDRLKVTLKWGYDNIEGTGSGNTFTVSNSGLSFSNDALVGYWFWIKSLSKNLKIYQNVGNVLYLVDEEGVEPNLDGLVSDSVNPCWIHNNADKYQLVAIPKKDSQYYVDDRVESEATLQQSPTIMSGTLLLSPGINYVIKGRATKGSVFSNYVELQSGSYEKYGVTQNYGNPFLAKHPSIDSAEASIGVVATRNGFRVTISGWSDAEYFEVCYTTSNSGADFNNPSHTKLIVSQRQIDINTSVSAEYSVKVRPIISYQEVGTALAKTVVSGSNGQAPEDRIVATVPISHITYSGQCSYNSAVPNVISSVSSIQTPSQSGNSVSELPESVVGKIITINGDDFVITGKNSSTSFEIEPLSGSVLPVSGSYSFTIGTSERGRRFYLSTLKQDHKLTRAEFDCDFIKGGNSNIRIYQLGQEDSVDNGADTIVVNASDNQFPIPSDVKILSSYGARTLVVDGYDIADLLNNNSVVGRLVIYGIPSTLENIGNLSES